MGLTPSPGKTAETQAPDTQTPAAQAAQAPDTQTPTLTILAACCIFLSMLEYAIPKPLPFLRIGLANLPIMLALNLPLPQFCSLLTVKVLAQALISGTLFSYVFLFSAAGSAASAFLMFALNRLLNGMQKRGSSQMPNGGAGGELAANAKITFIGLGTAGAFASNLAQLALAYFFILGESSYFIAPPLLACGIVTGILLGAFCQKFTKESVWYKDVLYGRSQPAPTQAPPPSPPACAGAGTWLLPIAGLALTLAFILIKSIMFHVTIFLLFWIIAIIRKKAGKPLMTVIFFLFIAFFNLIFPYGKVLLNIGVLTITEGALLNGIDKAAVFEGLIMISKLTISRDIKLPGGIGKLISGSFATLNYLSGNKKKISAKNFINDLDNLLLECTQERRQ